jgi:hypothetical protein
LTDIEWEILTIPMQLIQLPAMIGPLEFGTVVLFVRFMRFVFFETEPFDLKDADVPTTLR